MDARIRNIQPLPVEYFLAYYLEGLSELHGLNLEAALDYFTVSAEHAYATDVRAAVDAMAGIALAQQLMRLPQATDAAVQELTRFSLASNDPTLIDVARACEARIKLLQSDLAPAVEWAKAANPQLDRLSLLIWLESPPITQVRVLISGGSAESLEDAGELLRQIRELSEGCRFTCQTIEISVLEPLLMERQGRRDAALAALQAAVDIAAPGGWVRPFTELGPSIAELLEQLDAKGGKKEFIQRVLTSIETRDDSAPVGEIPPATASIPTADGAQAASAGADPAPNGLTNREFEVLELLSQRLQNKEIASRLFISTHTVNYHLKHIYQKLGVCNRRQAVEVAGERDILPKF